jgi:hypothetical protein
MDGNNDGHDDGNDGRRRKPWPLVAAAVVVLVAGIGIWSATRSDEQVVTTVFASDSTVPGSSPAPNTSPLTLGEPGAPLPDVSVDDFTVNLRIVDDTCLDTGGAKVTVQPDLEYTGPDLTGRSWVLTYEVDGGGSAEPQTIASEGGRLTTAPLTLSTPTCHAVLAATVTGIIVH